MPTFQFSKLVRDNIVDQQIASGAKPKYRHLSPDEHKTELINKIVEEAAEIASANPADIAAEIADVQQAIDDLKLLYGLADQHIARAQTIKNNKNGAFSKGIFIEHVTVPEDNEWVEYYRKNPDRYPEL